MTQVKCDFCSDPRPVWRYPARDAIVPPRIPGVPDAMSMGGWAACESCAKLIDGNNPSALCKVAATKLRWSLGMPVAQSDVRLMHDVFWRNRIIGESRRPYVAEPEESRGLTT